MNIVLIGFTASGKSVVGRRLAERTEYGFIDLDREIERLYRADHGKSLRCREIFESCGSQCFFDYEAQALRGLKTLSDTVLSTGGAAALCEDNRELLRELGRVIYLQVPAEHIFTRLQRRGFPVYLQDDPTLEHIERKMRERHPMYIAAAHATIDRTTLDIDQTVDAVVELTLKH